MFWIWSGWQAGKADDLQFIFGQCVHVCARVCVCVGTKRSGTLSARPSDDLWRLRPQPNRAESGICKTQQRSSQHSHLPPPTRASSRTGTQLLQARLQTVWPGLRRVVQLQLESQLLAIKYRHFISACIPFAAFHCDFKSVPVF